MGALTRDWDIGLSLLATYDADGYLGIQSDVEGSEAGGSTSGAAATPVPPLGGAEPYEVILPGGLLHRPSDPAVDGNGNPNAAQSAQVLNFREGGRVWSMPLGDPRTIAILPVPFEAGSTALYSDCGSFIKLTGSGDNVGQISLFTTDTGDTNGYVVSYIIDKTSGHVWVSPEFSKMTLDAAGFEVVANSGARLTVGFMGGMPGPLAAFEAAIGMTADAVSLAADLVQLGNPGALGRGPVVRGDQLQLQVIFPIITALQAIANGLAAIGASPAVLGSPPAGAAAAIPLVEAAVAALSEIASPTVTPNMLWISGKVTAG